MHWRSGFRQSSRPLSPDEGWRAGTCGCGPRDAIGLTVRSEPALLAELALKDRLPTMFGARENVVAGGLMSYSPDHRDLTRRAAAYIDKILKGANPADLPVEQASEYQLIVNLKTAKALGLKLPESFLLRADEVIE